MDKTVLSICIVIVIIITSLLGSVSYLYVVKYQTMADMVAKGADPQSVNCALGGVNQNNQQVCIALANKTK